MVSLICTISDHRDDINWCAFSPELLATCSSDKTVRVYSTSDFSEVPFSPLTGHGYGVHCCCFSPCGKYLASCSTDATTVIWCMDTGDLVTVFEHPGRSPVRVCVFSPDSTLVSGASDGTLALWDFQSKTLRRTSSANEASIVACSFTPCGQVFVTGSTYGDIKVWDLQLRALHTEKNAHDLGVSCCQFAAGIQNDGFSQFRMASCGQDSKLKIWMLSLQFGSGWKMHLLHTLGGQSAPVLSCAFSADAQLLVSGSVDKTITVYAADQGTLLYTLNQHERYVTACAFSATAPCLIATGSMDKTVNIWRVEDGISGYASVWRTHQKRPCYNEKLTLRALNAGNEGKSMSAENSKSTCDDALDKKLPGHSRLLVCDWSEEDVCAWLCAEGLESLVDPFKANNIDGGELISLTKDTLASEMNIDSVGLRNKVMRKIEELKMSLVCTGVPDEFLCPITREVMKDPVIAADGFSYERDAIESWINSKNRSSPMTNLPLQTTVVTPNRTLKMAIGRWKSSQ